MWKSSLVLLLFSAPPLWGLLFWEQSLTVSIDLLPLKSAEWAASFCVDKLTLTFLFMTLFVSSQVVFFSSIYMSGHSSKEGFLSIVLLFILSMLLLSSSSSLVGMMIGWDGLGITSFCLIVFYQSWRSGSSGVHTFITNRIGDILIILSTSLLLLGSGSTDSLSWLGPEWALLTVSAITKSAQFPFSSWLPRAMAAPTPVSALVHSSTLVTAGLFVLLRFQPSLSEGGSTALLLGSGVSILFAGLSAISIFDLKNIIAMSTLSHISIMFILASVGSGCAAMVHMLIHALFKSSLFMVAGWVIHSFHSEQDIRRLSLFSLPPSVAVSCIVSIASSAGAPLFSGFYSKELSFSLLSSSEGETLWGCGIFLLGVFLSSLYSVRLIAFVITSRGLPPLFVVESGSSFFLISSVSSSLLSGVIIPMIGGGVCPILDSQKVLLLSLFVSGSILGALAPCLSKSLVLPRWMGNMWFFESVNSVSSVCLRSSSAFVYNSMDINGFLESHFVSKALSTWSIAEWSLSIPHFLGSTNVISIATIPLIFWWSGVVYLISF